VTLTTCVREFPHTGMFAANTGRVTNPRIQLLHQYVEVKRMRALRLAQFGLENLRLEDVPTPQPADNEVLVKVRAASINPSDIKNVQGMMSDVTRLPRIPGRDFAGVVESGPIDDIGREVWGTGGDLGFTRDGTHAEYVVVPAEAVSLKPPNLSFEQAGALGLSLVTAWAAIFDRGELKKGQTLLVFGSDGAVGRSAVELATWAGARVIGVDRTTENQSQADVIVSSSSPTFQDDLKQAVGQGANVVFDTVGGPMFAAGLDSLAPGGRMVTVTVSGGTQVCFDLLRFYRNDFSLFGLNTLRLDAVASAMILDETSRPFEVGWLKTRKIITHPFNQALEAYSQASKSGGRHVLVMG
jgi:NADPH2:quinone reductase